MNHTELRDFSSKTLALISALIDKRIAQIRERHELLWSAETREEITSLLGFQTQVEYAYMLVLKEEKVSQS